MGDGELRRLERQALGGDAGAMRGWLEGLARVGRTEEAVVALVASTVRNVRLRNDWSMPETYVGRNRLSVAFDEEEMEVAGDLICGGWMHDWRHELEMPDDEEEWQLFKTVVCGWEVAAWLSEWDYEGPTSAVAAYARPFDVEDLCGALDWVFGADERTTKGAEMLLDWRASSAESRLVSSGLFSPCRECSEVLAKTLKGSRRRGGRRHLVGSGPLEGTVGAALRDSRPRTSWIKEAPADECTPERALSKPWLAASGDGTAGWSRPWREAGKARRRVRRGR